MTAEAKILLVDDDPISLRLLKRALETAGVYEIRTAPDGRTGLAEALEFVPDLIISDKVMPHMDGFEFCQRAKAEPALASSLFILLTSMSEPEARVEGLEQGADDYLVKPITAEELKARVRNILRRKPSGESLTEGALPGVLPTSQVIHLLVQIADLAVPGAANRAVHLVAAAQWMAEHLHMAPALRPHLDLAVHLYELGKIGLPPRLGRQLPSQVHQNDWGTFRAFAAVSYVLVRQVEALEHAALLVRHLYENWDGSGAPDHLHQTRIPLGSRILRLLADFFEDVGHIANAEARQKTLGSMKERAGKVYDPAAFLGLIQYAQHHLDASLTRNRRSVRVEDLRPGMRLAADLVTNSGALLLRQNEVLGPAEVRRIERHHAIDPFLFSISVHPSAER